MIDFQFQCSDGTRLIVNRWIPNELPIKGVVVIVHGMGEFGERYAPFAERLASLSFAVYAPDLRGHHRTAAANQSTPGHLADENGWERTTNDLQELTQKLRSLHPSSPLFLFGHSMGSLLARRCIQKFGDQLSGVIHSAASAPMGWLAQVGFRLAQLEVRLIGNRTASNRMNMLLFGNFNRRFRPLRTVSDWISSDEREVDRYIADERILKSFSAGLYRDMIGGAIALNKPENMQRTPRELPMLFISGDLDPLGDFGKGVQLTADRYKQMGCNDITVRLYANVRHELFQDYAREQAMTDICDWIIDRMGAAEELLHR